MGLGLGGLHAEGHAGPDAAHPVLKVLKRPANTSWELDKGLHESPMYLCTIVTIKTRQPLPFVTVPLDYPLRGVTVTYRDPT